MKKRILLSSVLALMLVIVGACSDSKNNNLSTNSNTSEISFEGSSSENQDEESASSEQDSSDVSSEETQVEEYTVTFDSDGGTEIDAVTVKEGEKIIQPENPQKSSSSAEYEFLGWYYEEEQWDFENDVVTGDITLVAKWKRVDAYTKPFLPKD